MGIRPYAKVVFGVMGTRLDIDTFYEEEDVIIENWIAFGDGGANLVDIFYNGNNEYRERDVYGFVVDSMGESDVLRGMLMSFTDCFGEYGRGGAVEFPIIEDTFMRTAYNNRMKHDPIPWYQMYQGGYCYSIGWYREVAKQIFDKLRLDVDPDDMKLMLVWGWA
jgi:hypothetical protein